MKMAQIKVASGRKPLDDLCYRALLITHSPSLGCKYSSFNYASGPYSALVARNRFLLVQVMFSVPSLNARTDFKYRISV